VVIFPEYSQGLIIIKAIQPAFDNKSGFLQILKTIL
jgi:hypothetical protein